MNKVRVLCETQPGLFSNEVSVRLKSVDGVVSFFADSALVSTTNNRSYLSVNRVAAHKDNSTVLLPSEAFESGSRWVNVPSIDLEELVVAK